MKLYRHSILALAAFGFLSATAQETVEFEKGEKHFENYSYQRAISEFEPVEQKTTDINRKLAESYALTGDTEKSESYFAEVVNANDKTSKDVYDYAAILSMNGKHAESEKWMKEYAGLVTTDSRGAQYKAKPEFYKTLLKDNGQFEIKNLDANSAQEDFAPTFCQDLVVFTSSREGVVPIKRTWNWNGLPFLDIYAGTPDEDGELIGILQFSKQKNKKYHEGPVSFNEDGDYMVFTRNNYKGKSQDGVVKLQLFSSRLVDGFWEKEEALPYNNDEYSVGHPSLSPDGNTMYFASDMPGGKGGVDIYKASRNEDGTWGEAQNLGEKINTEGNEMFPFIHPKGEMLFFASNGHIGLGGLDVFVAQVKPNNFGKVKNLGAPVNGTKDDFSLILDKDEKKGYFASNRTEGKGDDDIYSFELLKPFTFGKTIKGKALDKSGTVLAETEIALLDNTGNQLEKVITDADGSYSFSVDPDKEFSLTGSKSDYFDGANAASTKTEEEVILVDVVLEKDPGLSLYALITDKKTGLALEGVEMTITDNMTNESEEYTTTAAGDYRKPLADKKLSDNGSYNFTFAKEGYFSKTVTYNTEFDEPGQYNVHELLELGLDPEVKDLSELIEINPINFDYNKFDIREDASFELDKIVAIMNTYDGMVVELGSHTDSRGSSAYNQKLSAKRAKASAAYIKKHITNPERIYGKGYGESQIVNKCIDGVECTEEEHEKNRRTEFKVISTGNDELNIKTN